MFKTVGIVARYDKKTALKLVEELGQHLANKGLKVYLEDTLTGKVPSTLGETIALSKMKTDFIITIGGDGTILRTCITVPKPEPPILAINMGERGFLTEVEPKDACGAVDKILNGEYQVEECCKLSVNAGEERFPDALNDLVISAGEPATILKAQIFENERLILKVQADGLIVSTPTGSTGYSLSAGGPVLDPAVDAVVLSSICPLTAFPSLVFSTDSTLTFKVLSPKQVLVSIDGKYRRVIGESDPLLKITVSKYVTSFIRLRSDFYDRLRSRLLFKGTE